ncbi:MAG: hypothetical protein NW220_21490 [Leptolyngbyaceae cyanobacterium bins.349]|nr:hypothetical protein [Leptolyngbyaceae cyanobacterium bins.349]
MEAWEQPKNALNQAFENLRQSIFELKKAIEKTEKQLSILQEQYTEVLKEAKSWQTLRELSQSQGLENSAQSAHKKFLEVRQQAIRLKSQTKVKASQLGQLKETWNQASAQLVCIQVTNFEILLEDPQQDANAFEDTLEP